MTTLPVEAAYRLWAPSYDCDPNPLLALEGRVLRARLALNPGMRVLDLATGTGRWLGYALSQGAHGFGVDISRDMLARAAQKPGIQGRIVEANACQLPFPRDCAELAICSFGLGYVQSPAAAVCEMARVAQRVIVSDVHPEGVRNGWVRSFRAGGDQYEIEHYDHSQSVVNNCARVAGLRPVWTLEASFAEPERALFEQTGRGDAFEAVRRIAAVLISCWERP